MVAHFVSEHRASIYRISRGIRHNNAQSTNHQFRCGQSNRRDRESPVGLGSLNTGPRKLNAETLTGSALTCVGTARDHFPRTYYCLFMYKTHTYRNFLNCLSRGLDIPLRFLDLHELTHQACTLYFDIYLRRQLASRCSRKPDCNKY